MLREDAAKGGFADAAREVGRQPSHVLRDVSAVAGDEYFAAGRKKLIDPFPGVRYEAGRSSGSFGNTRVAGEKPVCAMLSRAMLRTASGVELNAL